MGLAMTFKKTWVLFNGVIRLPFFVFLLSEVHKQGAGWEKDLIYNPIF